MWREKEEGEVKDREQEATLLNLSGSHALYSSFSFLESMTLVDYGFIETLYTNDKRDREVKTMQNILTIIN